MCPKKNWLLRALPAIAFLGAAIGWSSPSEAYVQQILIDSTKTVVYYPAPLGSSIAGSGVNYTIYTGRVFGTLNPTSPLNAVITDIGLASPVYTMPTPPTGSATYIATFTIVTPTDPTVRSGLLIYGVSNRGGNGFTPNATPGATTTMLAGATYVQSGWQGDLLANCSGVAPDTAGMNPPGPYPCANLNFPYGTPSASFPLYAAPQGLTNNVIQVPVATTDRGSPSAFNAITGPVYSHIEIPTTSPFPAGPGPNYYTAQLVVANTTTGSAGAVFAPYHPVNLDTSNASFWSLTSQTTQGVDSAKTPIASTQWSWAYCPNGPTGTPYIPNPTWICLNNGGPFNTNLLYEMVFTAANPLVLGVGYAATRDLISCVRYNLTACAGVSVGTVSKAMIMGSSQSGAYVRALIFNGFNQDESNRIVFDGAWPEIDGRMLWLNQRFAQPTVLLQLYMAGDEAPVWWADFPNQARGLPANGLLHRCNATTPNTCPQIMEHFGELEFYGEKMGPDVTGFCVTCTTEIPLPANVYRYYLPGTTHGGAGLNSSTFNWTAPPSSLGTSGTEYPANPNPESPTTNALLQDFVGLLGCNPTCGSASIPMPPSASGVTYPSLAAGQLVPNTQAATGFPTTIPLVSYGGNMAWPPFVYNFGPGVNYDQENGVVTIQPPAIVQVLTPYVPTVNPDGNDIVGSVPSVLFQAPLGTYMGWNIIPSGFYAGQQASLSGGSWPFWDTAADRVSHSDPRSSLEERYGTHGGYVCAVTKAANAAVANRFLLPSDASTLISDATAGNVLTSLTPTPADTNLANHLCAIANLAATYGGAAPSLNLGIDAYYALIDLGATNLNWNGPIAGNVLVGQGLQAQLSGNKGGALGGGAIVSNNTNIWAIKNGVISSDSTASIQAPPQNQPVTLPVPTSVTSAALTAAQAVSNYAATLPATSSTQVSGGFNNGSTTITGNGGLNVVYVDNIRNTQLTLSGTANDIFVINVPGGIQNLAMTLSGGVTASHVLFNLTGNSGNVLQTGGGSVLYGTYLATHGGQFECAQLNLTGALINTGGNVHLVAGPSMTFAPFMFSD